jgi:hypothetical protein
MNINIAILLLQRIRSYSPRQMLYRGLKNWAGNRNKVPADNREEVKRGVYDKGNSAYHQEIMIAVLPNTPA